MDLKTLRRELKPLGFTFKTERLSIGRHLTYKHIESGDLMTFNVGSTDQWAKWQPLLAYLRDNQARLKEIAENESEKIYGLKDDLKLSPESV